ncbi:3-keto-5-aminohexanoate cleavage protein [Rhodoplanes serenus]|uniref:3-keto-5-aminohexanoate cleavage protein n=1 Tax=Rhodoplanes serenus TaxID=200615 RepID=A0A9X5AUN9_9BRAD|nr:3-keto-5-aminohexanoate cleavage protein [Rhodoplanes serenus]MTW18093.1 3-keto-5-aminohexanoate cleavage protein [Rhodoplanes serenus]
MTEASAGRGKRPVIVTCALTGGGDTVGKSPAVPVTPEQIAESAIEAARAGAAIVHIHVRDPATGKPATDLALYREVVERIRAVDADVILNLTTGAGARFIPSAADPKVGGEGTTLAPPELRVRHIEALRPEICTLDITTMNFGEFVFVNTPAHLRVMGRAVAAAGVLPELECFDSGNVRLALRLIEEGVLHPPAMFQLCLGVPWGAPATPESMLFMRSLLPAGAFWTGFGIGGAQFPMVAQAVLLGGHVRVGLEDNLYVERGVLAPSNAALVEKAVRIVRALDAEPASPAEARRILALPRPPA